jgi:uncharacterized protein with FMN-binding domain
MKNRSLVALSSAAIVAVYTAGYMRTRASAERFDEPTEPRHPSRPPAPAPRSADTPHVEGRLAIHPSSPAPTVVPHARMTSSRAAAPSAAGTADAPPQAHVDTPSEPPGDVPATPRFDAQSIQGLEQPTIDAPPPEPPAGQYKDGSYTGWGYCRHGDIQASVVIESGRIVSAKVAQCLTRYSCNWIEPLYPQVVQRQNAEVDYISGASESSDAFHDAIADALSKAK